MRLATIITDNGTSAARIDNGSVIALPYPDVTPLLRDPDWVAASSKTGIEFGDAAVLTHNVPAVRPEKTCCVGLNYRSHIEETNSRRPEYPTLFAKFPDSLTGATSPIQMPAVSTSVDWQSRISEWLAGKNFEASNPVGSALVSGDKLARLAAAVPVVPVRLPGEDPVHAA